MTVKVMVVFAVLLGLGFAADRGDHCVNRKGQSSTCTNIHSCKAALEAVAKANGAKIYATGEICGYDTEPLVCCQTAADFMNKTNENRNTPEISDATETLKDKIPGDLDIFTNLTVLTVTDTTPAVPLVSNNVDSDPLLSPDITASAATQIDVQVSDITISSSAATDSSVALNLLPETEPDKTFVTTESSILIKRTTPVSVKKLLPDRHTCGIENKKSRLEESPISTIDEFPWVALLRYRDRFGYDAGFRCTGTLINDNYVVTAAHCVVTGPELLSLDGVRLGEWLISSSTDCMFDYYGEECADKAVDVGVKNKLPHPQYDPDCGKKDIALVRLDKKIDYTAFIRPICLPVQNLSPPSAGTVLTTSGWGTTTYGFFLDVKSKVHLPVLNNYECLNRIWGYTRIYDDQICVGRTNPNDVCSADSGGPLMAIDKDDKPQWYLEGIMTSGFGCDKENLYGVYTRVTEHVGWILQILSEDNL